MDKNILRKADSYLGFLDDKTPMKAGKIKRTLTQLIRTDSKVLELRDNVLLLVLGGSQTYSNENSRSYGIYLKGDSGVFYDVTKTEWDFANYLIDAGFTTEEAVNNKIAEEVIMREKAAEEARQAEKEAEKKRQDEAEFMRWLDDKALTYPPNERAKLQDQIFADIYGKTQPFNRRSLVLIDHFDNPVCKGHLCPYLHTDNKASRKLFECLTGLKLPRSNKETKAFVAELTTKDFKDPIPYRKRKQPKEKELSTFYIASPNKGKSEFRPVEGEKLEKYGLHLFIYSDNDNVIISSADVGCKLVQGQTKTEALQNLRKVINEMGKDKIEGLVAEIGETYGWSPVCYR